MLVDCMYKEKFQFQIQNEIVLTLAAWNDG